MSKRLFVDCDDTLILYSQDGEIVHPYGVTRGEPHAYNRPLVNSVRAYVRDHPCALVVVWSGGGAQYARVIADIALPGVNVAAMTKDESTFDLVRSQDIVVDDMDIKVPARVFRPDEWVYDGAED
jgi:hypothetical protein